MYFYANVFAELAARVRRGDVDAQKRFREELESVMILMVRQTLRDGTSATSIARRILATARRLRPADGSVMLDDADDFVCQVAHNVCDEVVARLRPCPNGLAAGESIRNTGYAETLLV
jgi:hypothetical protein